MAVLTIESDEDPEHFADLPESVDRLGRELTPEEKRPKIRSRGLSRIMTKILNFPIFRSPAGARASNCCLRPVECYT